MRRRIGLALVAGIIVVLAAALALASERGRGYFGPIFAPDGGTVLVVVRDVQATVIGFGYDTWTPPARVWLHRDRFALVSIRRSDHHATVLRQFPPSPLEGQHFDAYHGAIFGEGRAHLRWADSEHLEYELAVTRPDRPMSRTFVLRHRWDATAGAYVDTPWQEGSAGMGGDEPAQLAGTLEVLAPRGKELLPCAVVVIDSRAGTALAIAEAPACSSTFPDGFTPALLADQSRRADIERMETIRRTYADLVKRGEAQGLSEGDAMLRANKQMEHLGYFPRSPTLLAERSECPDGPATFDISDQEFRVGLFQDIEKAMASPGAEVDKSGDYVIHRDYDTSRRLNAYLADRSHTVFFVRRQGGCWRLTIDWQERR